MMKRGISVLTKAFLVFSLALLFLPHSVFSCENKLKSIKPSFTELENASDLTSIYHSTASIWRNKNLSLDSDGLDLLLTKMNILFSSSEVEKPKRPYRFGSSDPDWNLTQSTLLMMAEILSSSQSFEPRFLKLFSSTIHLAIDVDPGKSDFILFFFNKLSPHLLLSLDCAQEINDFLISHLLESNLAFEKLDLVGILLEKFSLDKNLPAMVSFLKSDAYYKPKSFFNFVRKKLRKEDPILQDLIVYFSENLKEKKSSVVADFLWDSYLEESSLEVKNKIEHALIEAFSHQDISLDKLNPRITLYRHRLKQGTLDLALGFDSDLKTTELLTHAASYKWWQAARLVETIALEDFDVEFPKALDSARLIYFNLKTFFEKNDDAQIPFKRASNTSFKQWVRGLVLLGIEHRKNVLPAGVAYATEIELVKILSNPKWLSKTVFMIDEYRLTDEEIKELLLKHLPISETSHKFGLSNQ